MNCLGPHALLSTIGEQPHSPTLFKITPCMRFLDTILTEFHLPLGDARGFRQSDFDKRNKWLTAGDASVDPEYLIDQPLDSGHLAPIVHPNCRCVLPPVTD